MRSRLGALTSAAIVGLALAACGGSEKAQGQKVTRGSGGSGDGSDGGGAGPSTGTGGGFSVADSGPSMNGPDGSCGQSVIRSTAREANVLLVIDKSGSMTTPLGDDDRWTAIKAALGTALEGTKNVVDYGLDLFPSSGCDVPSDPALAVPVEEGTTGVAKILAALDDVTPSGSTPTAAALGRALAYFESGPGASLTGDKYVLLATDGGPNCNAELNCAADTCITNLEGICPLPDDANCCEAENLRDDCLDDAATIAAVEALADAGVHTFVVGIPGSELFETTLNSLAVAGGEPQSGDTKYHAVENPAELTAALESITRSLVQTCELRLEEEPPDPRGLRLYIDGEEIPKTANTWRVDINVSPPLVVLLGDTCAEIEETGAERVQIVYDCRLIE